VKNRNKDSQIKPLPGKGLRNVWCPRYQNCLNLEAREDWKTFTCGKCIHRWTVKNDPEDWECCLELIRAVFKISYFGPKDG